MDGPKAMNTISFEFSAAAKRMWATQIEPRSDIKAVVFISAKKDNFIAGADIQDIKNVENKNDLLPIIEDGVTFFKDMKSKNIPLVAAINGACLGGGLEWALWCDYRVASDAASTKMGLPEVKLGLLPGFGGTQNLFPLVGVQAAMDMMLTGKDIRPAKAKKMGLVDVVCSPHALEHNAIRAAEDIINKKVKLTIPRKPKSWMNYAIENTPPGQNKMWETINKMIMKNTNGVYPAPFAIIDCVKNGLKGGSLDDRLKVERENFVKLAQSNESASLIGIFDGMTALKKHNFGEAERKTKTIAVLGAGLMGAGIAQISAEKGYKVLLKDKNAQGITNGEKYIYGNWDKKLKKKRMTMHKHNQNTSNIVPLTDDSATWKQQFGKADMVIEAVFENIDLKHAVIKEMEEHLPEHCIFATNTSAIPIAEIAKASKRPENVVGMHYFSPVPSMPLLEIIPHAGTSKAATAAAMDVGTKQGKTCIAVKDVPGFYVNRCLGPFLVEVSALARDGASLELLDKSMTNFGMPVGPITLADEVGIDVASKVAGFLSKADLGARMEGGDISLMEEMVEKGWLGRKSQQGFYTYDAKNPKKKVISAEVKAYAQQFVKEDLGLTEEDVQNRIVSRFVNEAVMCLQDEIIASPVDGDIGLIFGTGFAPFRGGPFRYLDTYGIDKYVAMMEGFAEKMGPQFEPCQLMKDMAKSGKKFHN
jgi:enoyl-CoA hydratase/long-chain 3-hydroxyacyl-CoA dehydrogenase